MRQFDDMGFAPIHVAAGGGHPMCLKMVSFFLISLSFFSSSPLFSLLNFFFLTNFFFVMQ